MLLQVSTKGNWFSRAMNHVGQQLTRFLTPPVPLERPNLSQLAQPGASLPRFVAECAVARKYLDLLGSLDWAHFPERNPEWPWPGPRPVPRACFAAAYLIKLDQQKRYMPDLRAFLVEHPALVWMLGFPLVPSPAYSWGFDANASLPTARHFGRVLRTMDNDALQFLLDASVIVIGQELPPDVAFTDLISGDTKHIIAWVKENNPKAYIKDRYDKTKQPSGDPDCRLGCKRRVNKGEADAEETSSLTPPPTPTTYPAPASRTEVGEFYWGYGSGVVATKVADWGEFVLAELTQPFNRNDVTYFSPLMAQVERRRTLLGKTPRPRCGAFDDAFDAFYVYQYFHEAGDGTAHGFAAVNLSERGRVKRSFTPSGLPLCQAGLPMPLKSTYICHTTAVEHERGRFVCPCLYPQPTGEVCPIAHKNWPQGGCILTMPTCAGARIRYQLDRQSSQFKAAYKQRTATERVNSQAVELGIERPKLRNGQAITNQDTLTYVLINLRGIQRIRQRKAALARQTAQPPPQEATMTAS